MNKINSVKFKDKKSFEKNKSKANVLAVHEPFGIIVFKDETPVTPDPAKVSQTNIVDASLDQIASGLALLIAKNYNEGKHYLDANKIVITDSFEVTNTFFVHVPDFISFDSFYGSIMSTGLFISVEPDYIVSMSTSAETLYEGHWHLPNLRAKEAWALLPEGVVKEVAVLDVGCETTHEDLAGMISSTSWNCATDTADVTPANENEKHGTCCSGVIAANTGNDIGCMSIGNNHLKVQFLHIAYNSGPTGGFNTSDTILTRAMNKVIANPNCVAVSMSWGSTGTGYPIFSNALNTARTTARNGKGIPLFASSGNSYASDFTQLPASYTSVMAVGASSQNNTKAGFSNFGPKLFAAAPGVSLWTVDRTGAAGYKPESYMGFSGTSASSPAMAAVAGAILVKNPDLTETQVRDIIKNSCRKVGGYTYDASGKSLELGWGVVDMYSAVSLAGGVVPPPPSPTKLNVYGVVSTPATVEQGGIVQVSYSIIADAKVDKDTPVEFSLAFKAAMTTVFYTGSATILAGQSTVTNVMPYTVSNTVTGTCQFVLTVDPNNKMDESNETDNVALTSINVTSVTPPPAGGVDLEITLTSYEWLDATRCRIWYRATNKSTVDITSWKATVGFVGGQQFTWNRPETIRAGRYVSGGTVWYLNQMGTLPATWKIEVTQVNGMPDVNPANNIATILINK